MTTIEVKGITKRFNNIKALDNVNITIEPDKIYGLLGRNGAGKTTLLNLITNRIFPTNGDITIYGRSILVNSSSLSQIFYMTEKTLYPEGMKVEEAFKWTKEFYSLFNMKYAMELSEKFSLNVYKQVKGLSTGYTTIFKNIIALASNAKIIIFDEPILGLDANHRDLFYKELITNYSVRPKTIIISTHLIEEVANVLEEVIIIKEGKVILKESVEELLSSAYTISGEAENIDKYLIGKKSIHNDSLGKFKSVTVLENIQLKNEELAKELNIDFSKAELQRLFISLTN